MSEHHHHTEHELIIWHDHDGPTISGGTSPTQGRHSHTTEPPCKGADETSRICRVAPRDT